jgi:hypothetical protein
VLRNNQPADFAGSVPSTIFAFHRHHHLKYDDLIYCIIFSSSSKQPVLGSDEIMEDNRCFNDLKKCTKLTDRHTHLRWCEQLIKRKFPQCAPANLETSCLLEIGDFSRKLRLRCSCQFHWCALTLTVTSRYVEMLRNVLTLEPSRLAIELWTVWFQQDGATAHTGRAYIEVIR